MRLRFLSTTIAIIGLGVLVAGCQKKGEEYGAQDTSKQSGMAQQEAKPQSNLTQQRPVTSSGLSNGEIKEAQQALKDRGQDPGDINGVMSPATQEALRQFQKAQGLEVTGKLDEGTRKALGLEPMMQHQVQQPGK